jgi:hypothetical protein
MKKRKNWVGLLQLDTAYKKNLRVGENYSCTTGVFYREFSFSVLASDSAYKRGIMIRVNCCLLLWFWSTYRLPLRDDHHARFLHL